MGIQPPRTASTMAALRRTVQRWLGLGNSGTKPNVSGRCGSCALFSAGCRRNSSTVAVDISLRSEFRKKGTLLAKGRSFKDAANPWQGDEWVAASEYGCDRSKVAQIK